jgi:hypothetical protein
VKAAAFIVQVPPDTLSTFIARRSELTLTVGSIDGVASHTVPQSAAPEPVVRVIVGPTYVTFPARSIATRRNVSVELAVVHTAPMVAQADPVVGQASTVFILVSGAETRR